MNRIWTRQISWLDRQKNDFLVKLLKQNNYRSRAAYKLLELDEKFRLIDKKTKNIIDLGFAPGAWTQVVVEKTRKKEVDAKVLGVDLINCTAPEGSSFLQGNILSKRTHEDIRGFYGHESPADLILSDMMANTSGNGDTDHFASMELCDATLILANTLLKKNGKLVMKFYTGKEDGLLMDKMKKMFARVARFKPKACRQESREMYVVGLRRHASNENAGL